MEDTRDIDDLNSFGSNPINTPSSGSKDYDPLILTGSQINTPFPGPKGYSEWLQKDLKSGMPNGATNPINLTKVGPADKTNVTSSDGSVTSRIGELQAETILDPVSTLPININLESKQQESRPTSESTVNNKNSVNNSNSTTVNDTQNTSSVTNNQVTSSANVGVTEDRKIIKVENINNQSSSNTINENKKEKEKGGFLSKVGNLAKKAGATLNLPSITELGEQAKGLFGTTSSNINSRISEVKESFAINSNDFSKVTSPKSDASINYSNTASSNNTTAVSNSKDIIKTGSQTTMNVEQRSPSVNSVSAPTETINQQTSNGTSNTVLNTNTQPTVVSQQQVTPVVSQNTQPATQTVANSPEVGINIDLAQLAQTMMRLERILISGIDVTIKET